MYLSLVKKDFEIVFRDNIGILIVQMLFILTIISANMGILGYGMTATGFGWQLLMSVSAKDKENKTLALLIAMPYEKGKIVTTKYASAIIALAGVTFIYGIVAASMNFFHISLFQMLNPTIVLSTVCAYSLFVSITLPLYLIFDDMVVRVSSLFLIVGGCMIGYLLYDLTDILSIINSMAFLKNYGNIIFIMVSLISLISSRYITLQLLKKMEF